MVVDGHDFGSGEANIFIHTDDPEATFKAAKSILQLGELEELKSAYRELEGEDYTIVWPPDCKEFSIV